MLTLQKRNGQVSIEFMAILTFTLLLFSVFYAVISFQHTQTLTTFRDIKASAIADKTAYVLDLVLSQGTNVTWNMHLPPRIAQHNYTITLEDTGNATLAVVRLQNNTFIGRSAAPIIEGNLSKGQNTIRNTEEVLYVTQP